MIGHGCVPLKPGQIDDIVTALCGNIQSEVDQLLVLLDSDQVVEKQPQRSQSV
jgi:hypothetical protein